jgi:hypothetical protein
MKAWHFAFMALAGPAVGLALELGPKDSLLTTAMPFTSDSLANRMKVPEPAAGTNMAAPALPPTRERFLQFATRPLYPKLSFQPQDHLKSGTLGLTVEYHEGQCVVSTPVGLGMSNRAAQAWLATMPHTLVTNLDLLEFCYRATLVPQDLDGPGFSFDEARRTALRLTLAGKKWVQPKAVLGDPPIEKAWEGALRVPLKGGRIGATANEHTFGPMGRFDAFPAWGDWAGHGHHHGHHGSCPHGFHGGHHGSHPR